MATSKSSNNGICHTLAYEFENESEEPNIIEVSVDNGELMVSLYNKVPEDQDNVDVGCEDLSNNVTSLTIPNNEGLELAAYFREVADMLEKNISPNTKWKSF